MATRNTFQEDSRVLRHASNVQLINTRICWTSDIVRFASQFSKSSVPRSTIENVDQNTQALRTQVDTFDRSGALAAGQDHLVELARIYVPEGNVGHLEAIEQYLADSDGLFYASSSTYWGIPYNETVDMNDINWHFRLSPFDGTRLPRVQLAAGVIPNYRSLLPGTPWKELAEFSGLWYPAGLRRPFRGTIPAAHQLRFFAWIPSTALTVYSWNVAGRLTARFQSELCEEAQINTRYLA